MKNVKISLTNVITTILFTFLSFHLSAQATFSVSSGMSFKGTTIGYKTNNLVPYIGLNFMSGNFTFIDNYEWFDGFQIQSGGDEIEGSARIFIPTVGLRAFVIEKNAFKAFVNANVSFPMISGSGKDDGQDVDEVEDFFDNSSSFGFELGFGAEYFLSENFSVGGEFGLQNMRASTRVEDPDTYFDPMTSATITTTDVQELTFGISPMYSRFNINFYF